MNISVQKHDHGIKLFFSIKKDGIVEPLRGATVYLKLENKKSGTKYKRMCQIVDAELAECLYTLGKTDLVESGMFQSEIEVHYQNENIISTLSSPFTLDIKEEIVDDKTGEVAKAPKKASPIQFL